MTYLHQTMLVSKLLEVINRIVPQLDDNLLKAELLDRLSDFESAVIPSAIYLEEVFDYAAIEGIEITQEQAVQILKNAALDIDMNYVAKAVEYHVDLFIQGSQSV